MTERELAAILNDRWAESASSPGADRSATPVDADHAGPITDRVTDLGLARQVVDAWGLCGVMAQQDGSAIGYLSLAPALLAARTGRFAGAHLNPEAGVLLGICVAPEHRGHGLGRQLVQSAAAELARRQLSAFEAVGGNGLGVGEVSGASMVPTGFLLAVGFRIVRPHPTAPRLRMDLSTTVRWRPDLAAAWQRLTGLVSQPIPPQPAGFKQSRQAEQAAGRP